MIEVSKTNSLSSHARGPHFVLEHDECVHEDADGIEHIGVNWPAMLDYLEQHKDDRTAHEAFTLVINNSGMLFNYWAWLQGERSPALLFSTHDGRASETEGGLRTNSLGVQFVGMHLTSVATVLANKDNDLVPEFRKFNSQIKAHIHAFLAIHGVRANTTRIEAEFCSTCRSKQQ